MLYWDYLLNVTSWLRVVVAACRYSVGGFSFKKITRILLIIVLDYKIYS